MISGCPGMQARMIRPPVEEGPETGRERVEIVRFERKPRVHRLATNLKRPGDI